MADERPVNNGMTMDCMSKMKEMMRTMMAKGGSRCACSRSMTEMMTACCADTAERKNEAEKDAPN